MRPYLPLFVIATALASSLPGQTLRTLPIRREGIIAANVGVANIVAADVTGDGVADVISCRAGAPFAVTKTGSTFSTYWQGPPIGCAGVAAGDRDRDGSNEIIAITNSSPGKIMVF